MRTERLRLAWLSAHGERFSEWRAVRPFLGGALLILGGVLIVMAAIFLSSGSLGLAHASSATIGLTAAAGVFLSGVFALAKPELAGALGVVGVISAIVSVLGVPFAAFFGIVLSLVGGNLCYAWQPDGTDAEN